MRAAIRSAVPLALRTRLFALFEELRARLGWWRVQCPVCRGRFARFLPAGDVPRPQARCARCGALERHRLLWLLLTERPDTLPLSGRVLHVAAERCFVGRLKRLPGLQHVSLDLAAADADLRADLTALPLADGSVNVVLCSHVLEHVPDDRHAMAELARVLRPDGWALLQVPLDAEREHTFEDPRVHDPAERARLFGQWDHVRVYGLDYAERLTTAGFAVEVDRFAYELSAATVARYGILPEPIYVCRPAATHRAEVLAVGRVALEVGP